MREFKSYEEMSPKDFRAFQMKMLDILIYFDEFCKVHGLRYYLAGGTLLGAVRHRGFIPWDDDVDVHMPRPDYEKLPSLWQKFADNKKYPLCYTTLEKNYRHHAYSIADSETTYIEQRTVNDDIVQGIKIDVIPLDAAPKNPIKRSIQVFWACIYAIYNTQRLPENQGRTIMVIIIKMMLSVIKSPEKRYRIWKMAEKKYSKYDFEMSPYVKELVAFFSSMKHLYPRDKFTETKLIDFEGYKFPAHYFYKDYLKNIYSNYMQLPPESKRKPQGHIVYINLDKSFINYKGIYYLKGDKKE